MMKRFVCLLLLLAMLCGCAQQGNQIYSATYLNLFDTVTSIRGSAATEEEFETAAKSIHDKLLEYHRLFDIYNDYDGISNLKTVNDHAGIAPVEVDQRIIDLLLDCRAYYDLTGGKVNAAMGSVLHLWHEARNESVDHPQNAHLPEGNALQEASKHCSFDSVIIDDENNIVFITDPDQRLDVGAIAKGWAAQRAAEEAPEGMLISVGGNVCATGPKDENGTSWVVGVQDPDGGDSFLHTIGITGGSVVTSGDYQRTYTVDGQMYHHIIDPETLYPSSYWRSVTIVCADSGLADALSTALFVLPLDEGLRLLEECDAEAMWVNHQEEIFYSPGFESLIHN